MTASASNTTAGAGRRRDPGVDQRVLNAAMAVYGDHGWGAFTVDAVARRAKVGKASIYLRWPNKTDLLIDAVRARVAIVADTRFDNVRSELLALARQLLQLYLSDSGKPAMRLSLEAQLVPGLSKHWDEVRRSQILTARSVVRRAVKRDELPKDTSPTLLLDTLCGAVMMHAQAAPANLRDRQLATADAYSEQLVDFVLVAVRCSGDCSA